MAQPDPRIEDIFKGVLAGAVSAIGAAGVAPDVIVERAMAITTAAIRALDESDAKAALQPEPATAP
jgi:hypothetical protein